VSDILADKHNKKAPILPDYIFRCLVKITVTKSQQTFHRIFTFGIQACRWGNTKAAVSDTFKNMVEKCSMVLQLQKVLQLYRFCRAFADGQVFFIEKTMKKR
jgi:hypothetical protein